MTSLRASSGRTAHHGVESLTDSAEAGTASSQAAVTEKVQNQTDSPASAQQSFESSFNPPHSSSSIIPSFIQPSTITSTAIGNNNPPSGPLRRIIPGQFLEQSGSLRIATDLPSLPKADYLSTLSLSPPKEPDYLKRKTSSGSLKIASRTPSLKTALANSLGSSTYGPASAASSVVASPIIAALGEVTPLPSPIISGGSPGLWNRFLAGNPTSPPLSRSRLASLSEVGVPDALVAAVGSSRKGYSTLGNNPPSRPPTASSSEAEHSRNRSISDYVPEASHIPQQRQVVVSGSYVNMKSDEHHESGIRREQNYTESRGLAPAPHTIPTPPPSDSSVTSNTAKFDRQGGSEDSEIFEAIGRHDKKKRRWRAVQELGRGTFSRVVLATSQMSTGDTSKGSGALIPKTLVAVKICGHGPRGGADEERIEMSLKRELEIMSSIHHPSIVDLKAWSVEPTRALLVLNYSPGGDLFDIATEHKHLLTAPLLRRILAELAGALHYLHEKMIVHRDIKLENILVNLEPSELGNPNTDWTTYPFSVVSLTDLGLSRHVAEGEKLETRCGSEDYAAPEVILGQKYDGRATDAWSLGVLFYALLEGVLPFDPPPGTSDAQRMRSRTSHRIARIDWLWVEHRGDDGDHEGDEEKFKEQGLLDAMHVTEGLLRRERSRWSIEKLLAFPWIKDAIQVEGGVKFRETHVGEEVS